MPVRRESREVHNESSTSFENFGNDTSPSPFARLVAISIRFYLMMQNYICMKLETKTERMETPYR